MHRQLDMPEGDILIHVGDYARGVDANNNRAIIADFACWSMGLGYKFVVGVAGNHDKALADDPTLLSSRGVVYLNDSGIAFGGLHIWGSAWITPVYGVFNQEENVLDKLYGRISTKTNVLVTHSAPYDVLDLSSGGRHTGSRMLLKHCERVRPKLHVFGHCHHSGGQQVTTDWGIAANVANTEKWMLRRPPMVFDLEETP
jgi:Icc-related predicted phosphoesterase